MASVAPTYRPGAVFAVTLELTPADATAAANAARRGGPPPPPTLFGLALAPPSWLAQAPTVTAVVRGSPAARAGVVHAGDLVLAVNGVPWEDLSCAVPGDVSRLQAALQPRVVLDILPAPAAVAAQAGTETDAQQLVQRVAAVLGGRRAQRAVVDAPEAQVLPTSGAADVLSAHVYGPVTGSAAATRRVVSLAARLAQLEQAGAPPMRAVPLAALRARRKFADAEADGVDMRAALAYAQVHGLAPVVVLVTHAWPTPDRPDTTDHAMAAAVTEYLTALCPHPGLLAHDYKFLPPCPEKVYIWTAACGMPQSGALRDLHLPAMPLYIACCTTHLVIDTPLREAQAWCRLEETLAYAYMPGGRRALFLPLPHDNTPPAEDEPGSHDERGTRSDAQQKATTLDESADGAATAPGQQLLPATTGFTTAVTNNGSLTPAKRTARLVGAILLLPLTLALLPLSYALLDTLFASLVRPRLPGLYRHGSSMPTHAQLQLWRVVLASGRKARGAVRCRPLLDPALGALWDETSDRAHITSLTALARDTQRTAFGIALRVVVARGYTVVLALAGVVAGVMVLALLTTFFTDFGLSWQYGLVALVLVTPVFFVLADATDLARFLSFGRTRLGTTHARFVRCRLDDETLAVSAGDPA